MILDDIVAQKRIEVARLRARFTESELQRHAAEASPPRAFADTLRSPDGHVRLIAEIKRKSPSKGAFRADLDPAETARAYAAGGAACLSVLTDAHFFMGTLDDLRAARLTVGLPVLRKEFIIDSAQVYESRAAGADAILLIAAILSDEQLACLSALAHRLGMAALVEVHDEAEVRRALPLYPDLIGINNRDLKTFHTDLSVSERLRPLIASPCIVVSESGINNRADVERLQRAGVHAILVGESLVLADDVTAKVRELVGF